MSVKNPFATAVRVIRKQFLPSAGVLAIAAATLTLASSHAASPGSLQTLTLGWDTVPDGDVTSHKVYVGTASTQYNRIFETGDESSFTVEDLEYGRTYFFAVSAVDASGLEGPASTELVVVIATPPLPSATGIISQGAGKRALQWSFPRTGLGSSPEFIIYQSTDLQTWTIAETIASAEPTGGDLKTVQFEWPVPMVGGRMFFKMTATNWLGSSTLP